MSNTTTTYTVYCEHSRGCEVYEVQATSKDAAIAEAEQYFASEGFYIGDCTIDAE